MIEEALEAQLFEIELLFRFRITSHVNVVFQRQFLQSDLNRVNWKGERPNVSKRKWKNHAGRTRIHSVK